MAVSASAACSLQYGNAVCSTVVFDHQVITPLRTVRLADLVYVLQPFHVASFVLLEAKHCRTTGLCTRTSVIKEVIVFCIVAIVAPVIIMWYSESQQRRTAPVAQLAAMNTPSFAQHSARASTSST